MRIAVTDACIFIDLLELAITSPFFGLDLGVHTTIDVMGELHQEQQEILIAYQAVAVSKLRQLMNGNLMYRNNTSLWQEANQRIKRWSS